MPRPKFMPNEEQRRAIEAVHKAARDRKQGRARLDELLDEAIAAAAAKRVPVSAIAEAVGWSREAVHRHLRRSA